MRKLVFLFVLLLTLCACNRFRVRHDHSKHVQQVRVPVDTAQKDYVDDVKDDSWEDEDLIVLPKDIEHGKAPANAGDEIERMMKGEDVDFGE